MAMQSEVRGVLRADQITLKSAQGLKKESMMKTNGLIGHAASSASYDDFALVHACKDGDVASFEQLMKRHDMRLFGVAQSITNNREDAEEAVQEAFLNAFQNITQFSEHSRFSTWLIRITINEALTKLQKHPSTREVSLAEDLQSADETFPLELADWAPNPEELYRGDELREILTDALQRLRLGLRLVFVMCDIERISTEETAEALGLTPAAVKNRLWTARLLLRDQLSKHFVAGEQKARQTHSHDSENTRPADSEERKG